MECIKCHAELPAGALYCPWCGKKQVQEKKKALKRANGTGTVYKLQGRRRNPWVAARNKIIIGYYPRKTDALEALDRLTGKDITEKYNMTFADVYEAWKQEHFRDLAPVTVSQHENTYKVFAPLHDRKFRSLKTADFQAVIDEHLDKSYSTLSKYKVLINQLYLYAVREEIVTTNFAPYIRLPKEQKKEKEIFTEEDIRKLEADGSETAKIILMLIYTGMRINELFLLPVADYHGTYVIGGEKTEAGKNRVIPIRPEGREYFKYFAETSETDLLLSGRTSRSFRRYHYYPLLDKLGIERKTPHATRHTYASWAANNGMKPEVLQKIMGHAKYSTTAEIYVHSDIEQLIDAVEKC